MTTNSREKNVEYVRKCRSKLSKQKKQYINQYYCRSWKAWVGRRTGSCVAEDRNKDRFYDIDANFIMELLEEQSKKCVVTGIDMTHDKTMWSMSIDRIDNNMGHTRDNIQLICMAANLAKNKHSDNDLRELLDNIINPVFVPNKISRDFISSQIRNHKSRDERKGLCCDITTDYVLDLYNNNNKCFFTNISMAAHRHPMFSLSIDRIDNSVGHTKDNIRLTVKAINRAKKDYMDDDVIKWIDDVRINYGC